MKKYFLFVLFSIFLVGCQNSEDDGKAKEEVKPEESAETAKTRPLYETKESPKELDLRQEGFMGFMYGPSYYCWAKESIEDECMTELNDVHLGKLVNLPELPSPIGYPIELYFETYEMDPKAHLPVPDYGELSIYKDGTLTPVEVKDNKFLLPEEEGVYTYIYKTIYDGENKGVAFYTFKFYARNKTPNELR